MKNNYVIYRPHNEVTREDLLQSLLDIDKLGVGYISIPVGLTNGDIVYNNDQTLDLVEIIRALGRVQLIVELVEDSIFLVDVLVDLIKGLENNENIIVSSYFHKLIIRFRKSLPNVKTTQSFRESMWLYFWYKIGFLNFKKSVPYNMLVIPSKIAVTNMDSELIIEWAKKCKVSFYLMGYDRKKTDQFLINGGSGVVFDSYSHLSVDDKVNL